MEYPIVFDTLGYWVDDKDLLYVDLGFRFSDIYDALKFASFNGEIAIWDNLHGNEINVSEYLYPRRHESYMATSLRSKKNDTCDHKYWKIDKYVLI